MEKMKRYVDGEYIQLTYEEIAALKEEAEATVAEPTTEERLAALEAAMLEQLLGE